MSLRLILLMTEFVNEYVVLDGVVMPESEASIPVADEGFLRGDSVFEALRVYGGVPFGVAEHMARMERSAAGLRLEGVDVAALVDDLGTLIEARGPRDYGARFVWTRGGRRLVRSESIAVFPPSVNLATVEYQPTVVLDGLKTLSYGPNVLANRIAQERGHDEALLVTPDGLVLEGPTASFFFSPDGETLVTPPLDHGILASITRQFLIDLLDNIEVRQVHVDELAGAKEAFLCSAVREIQVVGQVNDHRYAIPGPLTSAAKQAYAELVQATTAPVAN